MTGEADTVALSLSAPVALACAFLRLHSVSALKCNAVILALRMPNALIDIR